MTKTITKYILKLFIIIQACTYNAQSTPYIEMAPDQDMINGNRIDWALLYEGAAYRHDLYLNIESTPLLFLATNDSGTGSLPGCNICSYPYVWGTTIISNSNFGDFFDFSIQINQGSTYFFSSEAAANPDGFPHAWKSNLDGFNLYRDLLQTSSPDLEDTDISNIITYFSSTPEVMSIINDPMSFFIGFEDIYNGGDRDYNDLIFAYRMYSEPTTVSEPPLNWLLIIMIFYSIWLVQKSFNTRVKKPSKIRIKKLDKTSHK